LSVENILRVLSVDRSLSLFEIVAVGNSASNVLRSRLDLTRKQYYSRLSALLKAGLIIREGRSYSLSSFGKIVYDAQMIIRKALKNYWKLAAIDSVQHLPDIGLNKIIDVLIENPEIKESLLKDHSLRNNGNSYIIR
jgi:predicted transcriptional regulator